MKLYGSIQQQTILTGSVGKPRAIPGRTVYISDYSEIVTPAQTGTVTEVETPSYTDLTSQLPVTFVSSAEELMDFTIYGKTAGSGGTATGVGNYDSATGKYQIPVTVSGKNILENYYQSEEYNGLTITVNSDKSITLNGTASAACTIAIFNNSHTLVTAAYQIIDNGTYILTGAPESQSDGTYMLSYRYDDAIGGAPSVLGRVTPEGVEIDNTNGAYRYLAVYIAVWSGAVLDHVTFRPMLRRSDLSESYEPHRDNLTVTLLTDVPLFDGDSLTMAQAGTALATNIGTNILTVDTDVQPDVIRIVYEGVEET